MTSKKRPALEEAQIKMRQLLSDYLQKNPDNIYEIAMILDVSISKITKWSNGRNLPPSNICPSIIRFLEEKIEVSKTKTKRPLDPITKGIAFLFKRSSKFEH